MVLRIVLSLFFSVVALIVSPFISGSTSDSTFLACCRRGHLDRKCCSSSTSKRPISWHRGTAYVYGMSKRWAFICRTTPDVNQQLRRLGHHISLTLIPAIPGHGFEGNCYILLRITDVMYRCLKEDLIYFENCVDFTFLSVYWYGGR